MRKITKYERDALKLVNKIRKAEGRKPLSKLPKGTPDQEYSCPLAHALDKGTVGIGETLTIPVQKLHAYLNAGMTFDADDEVQLEVQLVMPKEFETFIAWFDKQEDKEAQELAK